MVKDGFKGSSANACFAIFDGHGGQKAADFCKNRLSDMLESQKTLETNVMRTCKSGKQSFRPFTPCLASLLLSDQNFQYFRAEIAHF